MTILNSNMSLFGIELNEWVLFYLFATVLKLQVLCCRCSGLRVCEIDIPDKEFDRANPCPEDLRRYLQAKHECIKGLSYFSNYLHAICIKMNLWSVYGMHWMVDFWPRKWFVNWYVPRPEMVCTKMKLRDNILLYFTPLVYKCTNIFIWLPRLMFLPMSIQSHQNINFS